MSSHSWEPATTPIDAKTLRRELPSIDVAVVHFWASWNAHDRTMDALLSELRPRFEDRVAFYAIDTDPKSAHDLCRECEVMNLPALVCFKNGKRLETLIGLRSESELLEILGKWVS